MKLKSLHSPMLLSLAFYGLALALPAFNFLNRGEFNTVPDGALTLMPGWEVLALGWLGIFVWQFAWFANIAYFASLGLWLNRAWRTAVILSLIAVGLGLNTLFLFVQELPSNGAGATRYLQSLQPGFYCWMLGLSIPLLWCSWQLWQDHHNSQISPTTQSPKHQ
ncbi:MAG: hypothetical protein AAFX78_11010 [Cyanobacteria bacterium J06638_20]